VPFTQLADLFREVNIERDEDQRKFAELVKAVQEREEQATQLLREGQQEMASLAEDKQKFTTERDEWRYQKGRDLSERELKGIMEEYLENKIEELKPSMIHEARRLSLPLHNKVCEGEAVVEACTKAHNAGYVWRETKRVLRKARLRGNGRLTISPTAKLKNTFSLITNENFPKQSARHARMAIKLVTVLVIWMGMWKEAKTPIIAARLSTCRPLSGSIVWTTEEYDVCMLAVKS
jgi:hypothetical protein